MSWSTSEDAITITLPAIPALSTDPLSVTVPFQYLRTLVRLIVSIATYLLFRPQLERLFRRITGGEDPDMPRSVEGMKENMKKFESKSGQTIGGGRKVAVATSSGSAPAGGQGQKTRRKA